MIRIPFTRLCLVFGGHSKTRDPKTGKTIVVELFWPIGFAFWVYTVIFRGKLLVSSTAIVGRSANGFTHVSGNQQPIFLTFCAGADLEAPTRPIWGMDLTIEGARNIAKQLNEQADYFDSFGKDPRNATSRN